MDLMSSVIYFEVAENYGAGLARVFARVVMPGSLPLVLTGARLALNIALLLTIAVELIAAREGLGEMIWFAWRPCARKSFTPAWS